MWYTKKGYVVSNIYIGLSKDYLEKQIIVEISSVGYFKVSGDLVLCIEKYENIDEEKMKEVKQDIIELLESQSRI